MKIERTNYKYVLGCLALSVVSTIMFLIAGLKCDYEWFGKGGSIIVLFSVAAEYGLTLLQSEEMQKRAPESSGWDAIPLSFAMPKPFGIIRLAAHIFVVVGTLIWGFGDWFLEWVFQA